MNQVTLMGNIVRDPELKTLQSGTAVCSFSVAVNRRWTDAVGAKKEEATFLDCEAWAKTAENIAKFFHKGSRILLVGRLRQETWQDKDSGANRSKIKVVVETFHFVDGKGDGEAPASKPAAQAAKAGGWAAKPAAAPTMDAESIPF